MFKRQVSNSFVEFVNTTDYMSYSILGAMIYILTISTVTTVSRNLINEMRMGTLESIYIANFSSKIYLLANIIEQMIFALFQIALLAIFAIPLGLKISILNIPTLLLGMGLTVISIYGMSVILWGIMVWAKDTLNVLNIFTVILSILCGITFPIQYLPIIVQKISLFIPITYSVKILRSSILVNASINSLVEDVIILTLLSVLYYIISSFIIKKIIKKQLNESFL
jgi:ABC-2 type transport system permease protein